MEKGEEFEMLLGEIPHATSTNSQNFIFSPDNYNHVNGGYAHHPFLTSKRIDSLYGEETLNHSKYINKSSPVSGLSLQYSGSSSSLFYNGYSLSDSGSPIPPSQEDPKLHMFCRTSHYPNGLLLDSNIPDSPSGKKNNESLIGELGLCSNLSKMYIGNGQEDSSNFRDIFVERGGNRFSDDCSLNVNNVINADKQGGYENIWRTFSDYVEFDSPVSRTVSFQGEMNSALLGFQQKLKMSDFLGSRFPIGGHDLLFSELSCCSSPMSSPRQRIKENTGDYYPNPPWGKVNPFSGLSNADASFYGRQNGMNLTENGLLLKFPSSLKVTHPKPHLNAENLMYGMPPTNRRIGATSNGGNIQRFPGSFPVEESFNFQGEALSYMINKGINQSRVHSKGASCDIGVHKHHSGLKLDGRHQTAGVCGSSWNSKLYFPYSVPSKYNSLAEVQGYIYLVAKDQNGCRFLQRILDNGASPQDVQVIFEEIINHVVELMMNPFGNYFMQKLLNICNEEQKMHILFMVTAEPGDLVRISLNIHGTRVVQKLIETLKTRQEISLVISALEPGFLALIKDLNGNHVIQRCLRCFNNEDNKFIFSAASKYCVEIATHQHGCCVLQRCISCSTGEYRENLMAGISANGLLLAQDAYGNYVVQFILDLKVPSATSSLVSQFGGNYVHLSTQKCSSHVVEKCLIVLDDENRSAIIHELLSTSHFEQLLQDPHANYVIQTALRISKGSLHKSLVEAIESHTAILRNSPYSKKFFSQKLLKK